MSATAADHFVNILPSSFSPSTLNITVGDNVYWVNSEDEFHSVSSNNGSWNAMIFDYEGEVQGRNFSSVGTYGYNDAFTGATGTITVTAGNTAPIVNITSPTNNAVINAPATFTITAEATDSGGSIASVQFLRGTTSITTDSSSPYTANVTSLAAGNYTLHAIATDNLGLKSTNSVSIRVNALPTVSFVTPTNGSLLAAPYTGLLQVNVFDSDGTITNVGFSMGGSVFLGNDTNSPYSVTVSNLVAGTYSFQAMVFDNNAGVSTANIGVTVINRPFLSGTVVTNGQLSFNVNNVPASRTFVVEATTDLGIWSPISTNVMPASGFGFLTFSTNTSGNPKRFYRVQVR